jgi:hypothetical protein
VVGRYQLRGKECQFGGQSMLGGNPDTGKNALKNVKIQGKHGIVMIGAYMTFIRRACR